MKLKLFGLFLFFIAVFSDGQVLRIAKSEPNSLILEWNSVPSREYQRQVMESLEYGGWRFLTSVIPTGSVVSVAVSRSGQGGFYRLFSVSNAVSGALSLIAGAMLSNTVTIP